MYPTKARWLAQPRLDSVFAIFLLLLAFGFRISAVADGTLRWDEAYSVWSAEMDLRLMTERTAADVHPPLHYWFLHVWLRLAGISEFAIRAQAALFGLLTTALVFGFTQGLCKTRLAAALALLFIAISPFHIQWSQDARMYAQVTCFAALSLYAYWRGHYRLLFIAGIGTAMSHYFGTFVLAIILLHRLLHWRNHKLGRREFVTSFATIAIVYLIWLAFALGAIRRDPTPAAFAPTFSYQLMATLFAVGKDTHIDSYLPLVLPIASLFFLGLLLAWRRNCRAVTLIVIGCLLPPSGIVLLTLPSFPFDVHLISARFFVIFAPFVYAGWGIGLVAMLRRRWLSIVAIIAVVGLLLLNVTLTARRSKARYFDDEYSSMMLAVAALTTPDERLFFTSGSRKPFVYYYLDRAGYAAPKDKGANPLNVIGIPNYGENVPEMMQRVFSGSPRFWLIQIEADKDLPRGARLDWINSHYHRIYHIPVNGHNGISLYSIDPTDSPPQSSVFIPPVITEARPGDFVRIGVPAGTRVDLVHSGQIIDTRLAETWMLHQFDIYAFYFNGYYELRVGDESYPFVITHSRDFLGGT